MKLGNLEQLILFALLRLGGESHGAAIITEIEEHTGRSISPGALYTVLDRLTAKEFVESWIGDSLPTRGGRRRRVYHLMPLGAMALRTWYTGIQRLSAGTLEQLERLSEEAT